MSDDLIEGKILYDTSIDSTLTGVLLLTSKESIVLDRIEIALYQETRGRVSSGKAVVFGFTIVQKTKLEKNIQIEIPFKHTFRNHVFESYQGINFSFSYYCEAILRLAKDSHHLSELSLYEKMKGLFSTYNPYVFVLRRDIELKFSAYEYNVVESNGIFDVNTKSWYIVTALVGIGGIFILWWVDFMGMIKKMLGFSFDDDSAYFISDIFTLIFVITFLIGLMFALNQIIERLLGSVKVKVKNSEQGFYCILSKPAKFKLSNQNIYYHIVEDATDNRGTSSYTYSEIIHASKKHEISEFLDSQEIFMRYPEKTGLETKEYGDISMHWELIFTGTYLGITFTYGYKFDVAYA